jgi:hypothetical protein
LIHALVECLSAGSADEGTPAARRHQDIVVSFEGLLQAQPERNPRMSEICAAFGVSEQLLLQRVCETFGDEPDQLPSPPSNVAGASHLVAQRRRRGNCLGGRATLFPQHWPFRGRVSRPCSASCHPPPCGGVCIRERPISCCAGRDAPFEALVKLGCRPLINERAKPYWVIDPGVAYAQSAKMLNASSLAS